ncbi:MAG: hypothetical protein RL691_309 [Actinomycetota bacterium]|jgi:hypothetical protein
MGIFSAIKQRAANKALAKANQQYGQELANWTKDSAAIEEMLTIALDCATGKAREHFVDNDDFGFMLKADEFAMAHLQGVMYLEVVKAPTSYSGGYGGVSFPLFGRVRINTGRTGGQITPGEESIDVTDSGNALISNKRIMFAGTKRTHEWKFDKMMNCSHMDGGMTIFAMSTGKPAGLGYGDGSATEVQFRIELAAAMALGTLERYESELLAEKAQLETAKPVAPAPIATA